MTAPARRRTNLVLIQAKPGATDPDGWNDTPGWTTHTLAWVSIDPIRGREIAAEMQGVQTHNIRGDWLDLKAVTNEMRILFDETGVYDPMPAGVRQFDIVAVMRDEDYHEDVLLKVEEKKYGASS